MDVIYYMPNFCDNYMLSAPYFQQKPGVTSNKQQMLFDVYRQEQLLRSIKQNKDLRIQIYCGDLGDFRNSCYALCFWLKGNMRNVRVCAMENVNHNGTFLAVFGGTYYQSRLRQACMQIDREMGLRPDQ